MVNKATSYGLRCVLRSGAYCMFFTSSYVTIDFKRDHTLALGARG